MRFVPSIFERISGQFVGDDNKSNGRVTVEPLWNLNMTPPIYGGSVRGPFRWWQDKADSGVEWEVPNIKSITWDRSEDHDIASCTITLFNMWHEPNEEVQELAGQLGKPGYFWPKRGLELNRWNQIGGKGAFRKDGFWDPNFSWQDILVPFALIRTYEGYGGNPTSDNYISIQDNLNNENVLITGTWLIESISAGSSGEMVLNCKDIGILLLKELCFPPVVPAAAYPIDYYPAGKSPFDSFFGSKPSTGVSPASMGEVFKTYAWSSLDDTTGIHNTNVGAVHFGSHSCDGNWSTYSLSEGYQNPTDGSVYWEYNVNHEGISKVAIKPWAGGYECYLSIYRGGVWLGSATIPGESMTYVSKVDLGLALPDGMEPETYIEIPSVYFDPGQKYVTVDKVRITLRNVLYYSPYSDYGKNYRGGIRELTFLREGAKVSPYSPDFASLPWTYSMTSHPTRGYWVLDSNGTVHGFGDAADYDSSAFGTVPLAAVNPKNMAIAIESHPDGKGYWVLDITGRVYAYGSAAYHGQHTVPWPGTDKWGEDGLQAWDIACTHTGNGYWVVYGDGTVVGFGDAAGHNILLPWTNVGIYMNANVNPRFLYQRNGNGITGHPTEFGFWVTTGSGEVYAYGAAKHLGQLQDRVYNPGMGDSFRLNPAEFTKCIESTQSGNGYWISFGSGHIAAFGDAMNQGKTFIYEDMPNLDLDISIIEQAEMWGFFRALIWSIARDPDGTGFWVLAADGTVGHFNAEFWGQPGYNGKTGFRWHAGNYDGDYMSIIKEMLMWGGWVFYEPGAATLDAFGQLETTGISSDLPIAADKFDKRPILDIIKELCEVVGYGFQIREDGGVRITSKNIWRSGNLDEDGLRIYVDGSSYDRVDESAEGATEFIPLVDELVDLFDYNASITGDSLRSEIIIGSEAFDPKSRNTTGVTRHIPQSSRELLANGAKTLRDIPIPAMWTSSMFQNSEEMSIMAELIDLNSWFAARTGSGSMIANPCISVGDQVKFAERNTAEYNIHYIRGIKSTNDRVSGEYTFDVDSHWLGDKDNWVITADNVSAPVDGTHYFQISERVDRWQQKVGLGLEKGARAMGWSELANIVTLHGEFSRATIGVEVQEEQDMHWRMNGDITLYRQFTELCVTLDTLTRPLGTKAFFEVRDSDDNVMFLTELADRYTKYKLPAIGSNSGRTDYTFTLYGYVYEAGNGVARITLTENDIFKAYAEDSVVVLG